VEGEAYAHVAGLPDQFHELCAHDKPGQETTDQRDAADETPDTATALHRSSTVIAISTV
jgi:hypothetical protein